MFEVKNIEGVNLTENPVIAKMSKYNHEQLLFCNDNDTGLKAIIAIHNTKLGPALGGTRMWNYNNETEALDDVFDTIFPLSESNPAGTSILINLSGLDFFFEFNK